MFGWPGRRARPPCAVPAPVLRAMLTAFQNSSQHCWTSTTPACPFMSCAGGFDAARVRVYGRRPPPQSSTSTAFTRGCCCTPPAHSAAGNLGLLLPLICSPYVYLVPRHWIAGSFALERTLPSPITFFISTSVCPPGGMAASSLTSVSKWWNGAAVQKKNRAQVKLKFKCVGISYRCSCTAHR
jgi:hypothetical protein